MTRLPTTRPFSKVLVANRGEIAVRIMRGCREMGVRSVAVYSDPDRSAPHVRAADEAYGLGGATAAESYLLGDRIIEIARRCGAEAIHPGYGFLAENAAFAQACADAGLVFVGPPPSAMLALGSKTSARRVMQAAGVPVVPGTIDPIPTANEAAEIAREVGFPIALKAVSGGGGKGIRVVERPEDLSSAFRQASDEAAAAFGDPSMYLERMVIRPRHIEIQMLADQHGNAVHLAERECSVQRRHQKLVEEAPGSTVTPELRARMGEVAVRAAKAVGYTNAGTCEMLLDQSGEFYFLEVNARLQVEHPITELVTGIDLVHWQLRIAAGEPLNFVQEDVRLRGHAIECRIQAEDPYSRFFPSTGTVAALREPAGPGIRIDGALETGGEITPLYDSLMSKLIVWAEDRPRAIERMQRALGEYRVLGVRTTIPFHRWLMEHPPFVAGDLDTEMVARDWQPTAEPPTETVEQAAILAALAEHLSGGIQRTPAATTEETGRWLIFARRAGLRVP
jgi:acetyl-CoA carboxylase biotin carboxylase subunit